MPSHNNKPDNGEYKIPLSLINFLAGGIAGCSAKTFVAPLDRVKILYQSHGTRGTYKIDGVLSVLKQIVKTEGYKKLWRGIFVFVFGNGRKLCDFDTYFSLCCSTIYVL